MVITRLFILGVLTLQLCSSHDLARQSAQPKSDEADAGTPRSLLREAYIESEHFSPQERADILLELAQAAQKIDSEASRSWARELFQLTFVLQTGQNRSGAQKNALVVLAKTDPQEAAALFKQRIPLPGLPHPRMFAPSVPG